MMSAIANSLQKPERFDLCVRKFRALCMMHGVEVGSCADLHGFMQKLLDDRHLSMKFWGFVGDLSDREGGEFSDDQILAIVVEGVTGGDSSEQDAGLKQDVDNLRAMLSGVDIQGPEYSQVELAPFPRSEPSPQEDARESTPHLVDLPPKRSEARAAYISAAVEREVQQATHSPTALPPQLDENVLRYEISNLVKQYLEDLDNRVSKAESRRRRGVPMGTVANATTPRSLEEQPDKPPKDEMEDPPIFPIGRPRLVLEPPDDDDIPMNIPLENYSPPRGFGMLVLGVVLALAIFEGADAVYENRIFLGNRIVALMDGHFSPETKQAASGYRFAVPSPPPPSVEQGGLPAFQGTSTSTPPSTSAEAAPQQTPSIAPQIVPGPNSNGNSNVATSRIIPQVEQVPPDGISSAEEANAVKVAPSTMEANLVMSRVPVYPENAKLDRVEGNVVMEAIISKDGMVKHVHIIQGDSRLRNAAAESVYKRRYRPYIRDGQPVEVATTIAVDFRLRR
jgi:hypothetical protein